jgi:hypothetical protein
MCDDLVPCKVTISGKGQPWEREIVNPSVHILYVCDRCRTMGRLMITKSVYRQGENLVVLGFANRLPKDWTVKDGDYLCKVCSKIPPPSPA